ncbi:MAG: hypothetical protein ACR2P4_00025, partial [Gammaproteobacteria bacterium]
SYMTRDEASERFGEERAKRLQYKAQQALDDEDSVNNNENSDAWMKAEVWELWDKTTRQVVWVSKGYDKVLDTRDDPLQLSGFYPCPPFFLANATSTLYIPTSDYHLAQDLYNEVDKLQTRISIITDAVKVVGVYDSSSGEISRMFKEGTDNDLIPVENWALFAEKGGIQGQIDWFPIKDVVDALVQLVQMRDQTIGMLQQITGMSDLMRGELANQYEGVGQTQLKARFGSVRIQALQDQFAQYATDLMQIRAEVIARHFDPQTILARSNAENMVEADKALIMPAVELIKQPEQARLRVKIRPESVAMVDYAELKNERTEYINALAVFLQSAAPLVQMDANTQPFLLELLKWGLAGFKGASEIEGVIDKAIEKTTDQAENAQDQPDPEQQAQQQAHQFEMALEKLKASIEIQKIQAKAQADTQTRQMDAQADMQQLVAEQKAELERLNAELTANLAEIRAKLEADLMKETAQAQGNMLQAEATASAEVGKDIAAHELELEKEAIKTQLKIDEIQEAAAAKIAEARAKPGTSSVDSTNDND